MAEKIQTVWVSKERIDDRIDTRPYKPWVLKGIDSCRSFSGGTIKLGSPDVNSILVRGIGGASYKKESIAVFKAKNVTGYGLSCPEVFSQVCPKDKILKNGDILLTSSGIGTIGRADLFPGRHKNLNSDYYTVDNHVSIIRLKEGFLQPGYLVAFLNSYYGKAWSEWGTTGSTRLLELAPRRVSNFKIPMANKIVQMFIGKKIEIAEFCRTKAIQLEEYSYKTLSEGIGNTPKGWIRELPIDGVLTSGGFANMIPSDIIRNRLDPVGYHPELLEIQNAAFRNSTLFSPLRDIANTVTSNRGKIGSDAEVFVSILHVNNKGYIDLHSAKHNYPESPGRVCFRDDLLISCINPAANRIAVYSGKELNSGCSTEFSIINTKKIDPYYLAYVLRTEIGLCQLIHLGRGTSSSRRRVDEEELLNVQVPLVPEQRKIAEAMKVNQMLIRKSFEYTKEAVSNVENLIEGKLGIDEINSGQLKPPEEKDVLDEIKGKIQS